MIESSKYKRKIIRENAFEHKKEKPNRPSNNLALMDILFLNLS